MCSGCDMGSVVISRRRESSGWTKLALEGPEGPNLALLAAVLDSA